MTARPAPRAGTPRKRDAVTARVPRGVTTRGAAVRDVALRPAAVGATTFGVDFGCLTMRGAAFCRVTVLGAVRRGVTMRGAIFCGVTTRCCVRRGVAYVEPTFAPPLAAGPCAAEPLVAELLAGEPDVRPERLSFVALYSLAVAVRKTPCWYRCALARHSTRQRQTELSRRVSSRR